MAQRWSPKRYVPMAEYLFPASRATVEALAVSPGGLLVDCATGTGNAAMVAVERGLRVLALDSSPEQVTEARQRCRHPGAHFVVADAQNLPLPAARAAAAVSVFGIIFTADPQRAMAELVRCVPPGAHAGSTGRRVDRRRRLRLPPRDQPLLGTSASGWK
ncbi:MAG: class I SAM-dependent methyltransferase [Pseudonocardiaceae bacterium]